MKPSFVDIYPLLCWTDCSQTLSHGTSGELGDPEDSADTSIREEDKCNFMDFAVREVAEQLTRLDAVGFFNKYLKAFLFFFFSV